MANARKLALKILRRTHSGAFASSLLRAELTKSSLTQQQRSMVTDLIYGTLRYELYLDSCLKNYLKQPSKLPPEILEILRLGGYEKLIAKTPHYAAVGEWVKVCKQQNKPVRHLYGLVNAVLQRLEHNTNNKSTIAQLTLPAWLFTEWCELFGEENTQVIAEATLEPEPLWLKSYHPEAINSLETEGCQVTRGKLPSMLAVRISKPLPTLKAFERGLVQPQNPASTLPVKVLAPQKNEYVLDLCSGNGIKAAEIASLGAKVTSVELHEKKLLHAKKNLQRLNLTTKSYQHNLQTMPPLPPAPKVLLDAPCSGTGTLRGNPEVRQRVTSEKIAVEIVTLQQELLETAAALTQKGGRLVYAVCALTRAEGNEVIKHFLTNHPEFTKENFTVEVPTVQTTYGQYILPLAGLDGFFIAALRKN